MGGSGFVPPPYYDFLGFGNPRLRPATSGAHEKTQLINLVCVTRLNRL